MIRLANFEDTLVQIYHLNNHDTLSYFYVEPDTFYIDGDTTYFDHDTIYSPFHIYQLEDGVRSVNHARQYWEKGIIFRYHKNLLWILFPFIFLMIAIPYLSLRQVMLAFFVIVGWYFLLEIYLLDWILKVKASEEIKLWKFLFFNPFILLSFIGLVFSFFIKKRNGWTDFSFHLFLVSLLGTLAYLIYYSVIDVLFLGWSEIGIYELLGGLSFLSLVGCYLTPHYQSMPRSS